jgi:signal transduction histidine kinase
VNAATAIPIWLARVRVRVTLAATAVSLLGAVVGSSLFVAGLHESLEQALVGSAQQQVGTVEAQLAAGGSPQQATVSGRHDVIVQILGADGKLIASDHPGLSGAVRTTAGASEGVHIPHLEDTYAVWAQQGRGGQLVIVGLSEEQAWRAVKTAVVLLAVAVPVGVLLIAVVVWLSIGRALRPIEVMRREAAVITTEHLHARLAVPGGDDEIPLLAATLNEMLDRIDGAQRQQRQFVSDASHELRSPLAILRQVVDVARRHPESTTMDQFAQDVSIEERRMEQLVTALLTLARLDDHEETSRQLVDIDDAVLVEIDRLRSAAPGIVFDRSGVSAGQAYGDPVLFAGMVANLLSNAARHAASRVRVRLAEAEGSVVLTVEDDGDGIPSADRDRVFDRFARLDEARARDAGGAGLGLAIVQKVVQAAGGTVTVADSDLGGARFTMTLPSHVTEPRPARATSRADDQEQ